MKTAANCLPALIACAALLVAGTTAAQGGAENKREARLSCAVALVSEGDPIKSILEKPGPSFVQAYVRFASDLPDGGFQGWL
ncbi:MAG: hypothetical protein L0Z50_26705 [Verrucomicrobiales bacterium]|nr:hypothetical protein [Verrucomicrobiales bacterium]